MNLCRFNRYGNTFKVNMHGTLEGAGRKGPMTLNVRPTTACLVLVLYNSMSPFTPGVLPIAIVVKDRTPKPVCSIVGTWAIMMLPNCKMGVLLKLGHIHST